MVMASKLKHQGTNFVSLNNRFEALNDDEANVAEDDTYEIPCTSSGEIPKSYSFALKNKKT